MVEEKGAFGPPRTLDVLGGERDNPAMDPRMIRSLAVITVMLLLALAAFSMMLRRYQAVPRATPRQPRTRMAQPPAAPAVPVLAPDAPIGQPGTAGSGGEATSDVTNSAPAGADRAQEEPGGVATSLVVQGSGQSDQTGTGTP
jgi:hypothetical protein